MPDFIKWDQLPSSLDLDESDAVQMEPWECPYCGNILDFVDEAHDPCDFCEFCTSGCDRCQET